MPHIAVMCSGFMIVIVQTGVESLLSKAGRRMHKLRVCKKDGYSLDFFNRYIDNLIDNHIYNTKEKYF